MTAKESGRSGNGETEAHGRGGNAGAKQKPRTGDNAKE